MRRLVQDVHDFKQTAALGSRPEQMLHHLSGVYAVVFGLASSNIPNHLRPPVGGARRDGEDGHTEVGRGRDDSRGAVVKAGLFEGEIGREMLEVEDDVASVGRPEMTGDAGRCMSRGSLPARVQDVSASITREVTFLHCRNEIICR